MHLSNCALWGQEWCHFLALVFVVVCFFAAYIPFLIYEHVMMFRRRRELERLIQQKKDTLV